MIADIAALVLMGFVHVFGVRRLRSGRQLDLLLVVLSALIVESLVYADPNAVPLSIVHPAFGSTNVRMMDLLAIAGLTAVLRVRGLPKIITLPALLWACAGAWIITAAVYGHTVGDSGTLMLYELKAVLYISSMYAMAAVVPREQWLGPRMRHYLVGVSVVTLLMIGLSQSHTRFNVSNPILPLVSFGDLGSDGATILAALAMISLAIAVTASEHRLVMLCAAGPLLLSTVAAQQRAAVLGASVAFGVFLAALVLRRAVLRIQGGEIFLVLAAVVGLVLTPIVVGAARGGHTTIPLAGSAAYIQGSQEKQLSSQGRLNQWHNVIPLIEQEPIFGHGLGATYQYYEPGPETIIVSDLTHNIGLDLLYRGGVVALILVLVAFGSSIAAGWRQWLMATTEPAYAALALAVSAVTIGWIAKGQAESLFEKYRLALLLGMLLGMIESLRTGAVPDELLHGGLPVRNDTLVQLPTLEQVGS